MGDVVTEFSVSIDQVDAFEFRVTFDKEHHQTLMLDEPPPLGKDAAPNAGRILAAAVGNCLSASLLFCAGRGGLKLSGIHTDVKVQISRNEQRRLRISKIDVAIDPRLAEPEQEAMLGCLEKFEEFCTVTQSVRQGIEVNVSVKGLD